MGAGGFDVAARGVEMRVRWHNEAGGAEQMEQDGFGGAALVRGDDVAEGHEVAHRGFETFERGGAGVAFVAQHDGSPLARAHRRRSRVGQEIYQDVIGAQGEEVVVCGLQEGAALLARGHADGFYGFDTEGFDDGLHGASPLRPMCLTNRGGCAAVAGHLACRAQRPDLRWGLEEGWGKIKREGRASF